MVIDDHLSNGQIFSGARRGHWCLPPVAYFSRDVWNGRFVQTPSAVVATVREEFQEISDTSGACRIANRSYKVIRKRRHQPNWTFTLL